MKTYCNGNCNQGRNCNCVAPSKHEKSDRYIKWLLIFAALYFLGHIFAAAVQAQTPIPSPTQPIIQCWNNGFGTIQCIQL